MIYLASPYSHDQAAVRESRFEAVRAVTGKLIRVGHVVFSPIVYSHQFAESHGTDFAAWEQFDLTIIAVCRELWVLRLGGWETSKGVWNEIEYAKWLGKPVKHLNPETMEVTL